MDARIRLAKQRVRRIPQLYGKARVEGEEAWRVPVNAAKDNPRHRQILSAGVDESHVRQLAEHLVALDRFIDRPGAVEESPAPQIDL
ncbi:MAG: hypothetical protein AAGH41_01360 [Pseudomonadota bacterium]